MAVGDAARGGAGSSPPPQPASTTQGGQGDPSAHVAAILPGAERLSLGRPSLGFGHAHGRGGDRPGRADVRPRDPVRGLRARPQRHRGAVVRVSPGSSGKDAGAHADRVRARHAARARRARARATRSSCPGWSDPAQPPSDRLCGALRAAHDRGARVVSLCTGAFVLAHAGLLDGRRATTHWRYADDLRRRYPLVEVDPNPLYVSDGAIHTSAGTAAGIDLCLALVAADHGVEVAAAVARRLVMPLHRPGGQAQYIDAPIEPPAAGAARLGARAPRRRHPRRRPRDARVAEHAHAEPALRPPRRRHAGRVARARAAAARPAPARADRGSGRGGRAPRRLRVARRRCGAVRGPAGHLAARLPRELRRPQGSSPSSSRSTGSRDLISSRARSRSSERPTVSAAASAVAVQVPDGELAFVDRAAHDLLAPAERRPDVLHPRPVGQVGEEVRDDVVGLVAAHHRAARRPCPGSRRRPSARSGSARRRGRPIRTRRCRRRRRRPGRTCAGTSRCRRRRARRSSGPALEASITSGDTPAPTITASAGSSRPDFVTTFATRPSPSKRSTSSPPWISTPWSVSTFWKNPPAVLPKVRSSVDVLLHHDRALAAERGQRRRDLGGDVGAADEHHVLGVLGVRADRVGVVERAQVVDAVEVGAVEAQAADVRAGGEQQLAVADHVLVGERDRVRLGVELHRARARQQLDVVLRRTSPRRRAGRPRATSRRRGSPSTPRSGRTAGRDRARRRGSSRRRPPRAASARRRSPASPPPTIRNSISRSGTFELRLALLGERREALLRVGGLEQPRDALALARERVGDRHLDARVGRELDLADRDGRAAGQRAPRTRGSSRRSRRPRRGG